MTQVPDSNPTLPGPAKGDMSWAAITSLICGIVAVLGLCTGWIPVVGWFCCSPLGLLSSLAGIVFGIIGLKSEKGMLAKIGIGLCVLYFVLAIIGAILFLVFGVVIPGATGH